MRNYTRFLVIQQVFFLFIVLSLGVFSVKSFAHSSSPSVVNTNDKYLVFTENKGQWPSQVKFNVGLEYGAAFFTSNGIVYHMHHADDVNAINHAYCHNPNNSVDENFILRSHAYKVKFVGANNDATITSTGIDKETRYVNYFIGNDRSKWASHVGLYKSTVFSNVYDGINIVYYSSENGTVKYDFVVKAGSNPGQIKIGFEGDVRPSIDKNGDLVIATSIGNMIEKSPISYQVINGERTEVASSYKLLGDNTIVFEFPDNYNPNYDLIIDPELVFATYSGSRGNGDGMYSGTTTYDNYGNMYVGAKCWQTGWPTTIGAFQERFQGGSNDIGINKYNALGTAIVFSTYVGGSGQDIPYTLRVNSQDELVVGGSTTSRNLPMSINPFQATLNGTKDLFLLKLSVDGSQLLGSTYIGSTASEFAYMSFPGTNMTSFSEEQTKPCAFDIAFDDNDNLWMVTNTTASNWPTTSNAFQLQNAGNGTYDGVIMKLSPDLSSLLYSTYLGGSANDVLYSLDILANGDLVVGGGTHSNDMPTTPGSYMQGFRGQTKGFVAVINHLTGGLEALTYVGADTTNADQVLHIKVDPDQNIVVLGKTMADYFPISTGAFTNNLPNRDKIFIQKFTSDLRTSLRSTLIKSTSGEYFPSAFTVDICGNIYISALRVGANMPLTTDAFQTDTDDFWMGALDKTLENLIFGSYFGSPRDEDHTHVGVNRFDPQGIVYHSICGSASSWPTTQGAVGQTRTWGSGQDIISFKFNFDKSGVSSVFEPNRLETPMDSFCAPHTVNFVNNSSLAKEFIWDFGDGSPTDTARTPSHTYNNAGVYKVTLISINDSMCITHDTAFMYVHVYEVQEPILRVADTNLCVALDSLLITVEVLNPSSGVPGNVFKWTSSNAGAIYAPNNTQSVWINPRLDSVFNVTVLDSAAAVCTKTSTASLNVKMTPRNLNILTPDTAVCRGDVVNLRVEGSEGYSYRWNPVIGLSDSTALEPSITVNRSQLYMITASYPYCIDTSDFINIVMHEYPEVEIRSPQEGCQGSEIILISNVNPYRNDYVYNWSTADDFIASNLPNLSFIADTVDRYYWLKVATPIGCSDSSSAFIVLHSKGNGDAIAGAEYCAPGSAQLWASNGVSYEWNPTIGLDNPYIANPTTNTTVPIEYEVYITDENSCIDTLKVIVDVHPRAVLSLPKEITIYEGGEGYLVKPETNAMYFEWFPHAGVSDVNISDPILNPSVRTRYFVSAKTEYGCETSDSIDILVGPASLNMPNAFNPSNPEAPLFKPIVNGDWSLKSFKIYNRWGDLLYESTLLNDGWDGKFNDVAQPLGVYVWVIEAQNSKGETVKRTGNVTLVR